MPSPFIVGTGHGPLTFHGRKRTLGLRGHQEQNKMNYIVSTFGIECPETGRLATRIDGVDNRRFLHPQYWERDNEYKSPAEAIEALTSGDPRPVFVTMRGKILSRAAAELLMGK